MGMHVESFPARGMPTRTWAIVGAVVLLFAALGAGVLIGRATETTTKAALQPERLASAEVVRAIDDSIAAWNRHDAKAATAIYSRYAVVENVGDSRVHKPRITDGRAAIARGMEGLWSFFPNISGVQRLSEVTKVGDHLAYTQPGELTAYMRSSGPPGFQVVVDEWGVDGKIVHEWVVSP